MRFDQRTLRDVGLLALRLMLATVFLYHGSQKLLGLFDGGGIAGTAAYLRSLGLPMPTASALLAALAETGGALALATGRLLRPAMVPLAATMLVAAFAGHDGFDVTRGGMEYPLTLAVAVLSLALVGPGELVLGRAIRRAASSVHPDAPDRA